MKITKKSLLALVLSLLMVVSICSVSVPAEAASSKKSVTLYVGEVLKVWAIGGSINKVSSNKKKVCAVKKKSGDAILTAKKPGKAVVTMKNKRGTITYTVTVKKKPFSVTTTPIKEGVMISVKNTTAPFISSVSLQVTFCDAAGNPINQSTRYVDYIGKGQTGYEDVYCYDAGIDFTKTQVKVLEWSRSLDYKYKNYASKVNMSWTEEPSTYGTKLKFSANSNYSGKGSIYIASDVICYDGAGQILGVITGSAYLYSAKNVYTDTYGVTLPDGTVRYEVVSKRAILKY